MKLRFLNFKRSKKKKVFPSELAAKANLFNKITNFQMTRQIFTHRYLLLTYSSPSSWERWSVWRMINCFKSLFPSSLFSFVSTCTSCHWIGGVNQKSTSHLDILLSRRFLIFFSPSSSSFTTVLNSLLFFCAPHRRYVLLLRSVSSRGIFHIKSSHCLLSENWWVCRAKSLFNACLWVFDLAEKDWGERNS